MRIRPPLFHPGHKAPLFPFQPSSIHTEAEFQSDFPHTAHQLLTDPDLKKAVHQYWPNGIEIGMHPEFHECFAIIFLDAHKKPVALSGSLWVQDAVDDDYLFKFLKEAALHMLKPKA